ncbi:hypothetical protein DLAC_01281 [Tieghemostelium lacteum]|uniref:Uncharacterized protein n=1 Tax=Tieghemostelium lacteum TaxID=361077 RepID=A0A152A882_TIELA|nr:hypothetical protein DLAC_01281 [Tieghemostelium lacteum]|eukprot:KYR02442.1 hypothetical protein DLAC_01281 [Tieghemostelium lacteum]
MSTEPESPKLLIIRVIKSMEYRTIKNLILKDIDLNIKVSELKDIITKTLQTAPGFAPFRTKPFDTLKIFFIPHKQKPNNLTINLDNDHYFLKDDATLAESGVVYETEISYFIMSEYETYKQNPQVKW